MNTYDRILCILHMEENNAGWQQIKAECDEVIRYINENDERELFGTTAYQFLEDYDVREKSLKYAKSQRNEVRRWLAARRN